MGREAPKHTSVRIKFIELAKMRFVGLPTQFY